MAIPVSPNIKDLNQTSMCLISIQVIKKKRTINLTVLILAGSLIVIHRLILAV